MVKRKNKLIVEPFDDIRVIGINTSMMDYQLAWNLNKVLKIDLAKYKSVTFNEEDFFSYYLYDAGENANTFNLVSLVSTEGKEWVSFKPKTDYLFIIRNYIKETDLLHILAVIKNISKVFHAYIVDTSCNNKIDIILEDIEFHEIELANEESKKNSGILKR
ncbi:MAG: IPExxxVDY family protein [Bacteroidales bacterium]|nr:IPExxxVDY family protein [Bacteroidales bacterium]